MISHHQNCSQGLLQASWWRFVKQEKDASQIGQRLQAMKPYDVGTHGDPLHFELDHQKYSRWPKRSYRSYNLAALPCKETRHITRAKSSCPSGTTAMSLQVRGSHNTPVDPLTLYNRTKASYLLTHDAFTVSDYKCKMRSGELIRGNVSKWPCFTSADEGQTTRKHRDRKRVLEERPLDRFVKALTRHNGAVGVGRRRQ